MVTHGKQSVYRAIISGVTILLIGVCGLHCRQPPDPAPTLIEKPKPVVDAASPVTATIPPAPTEAPAVTPVAATPAPAEQRSLVGEWESVAFVEHVEGFVPHGKERDLFLTDFRANADGTTSLGWTWHDDWVTHRNGYTRAQYVIKDIDGTPYLFLPWLSGDVIDRGMTPWYYVFVPRGTASPSAADHGPTPSRPGNTGVSANADAPVNSLREYDDVRWKDISHMDLSGQPGLAATLTFNQKTVWPSKSALPPGAYPGQLMTASMNPGLGVRELHRQGITGTGINVAIIDQPLYDDHPEFAGKIAAYHDVGCDSDSSMHGPAVASLLVGTNCGTAPGATLYFAAAPSWTKDTAYQAKALDWIVAQNESLPVGKKIRVVSVSAAPSGLSSPFERNLSTWDDACARAEAAGIMVLDCTTHHGFIGPCYYDAGDPEDVTKCRPGFPGRVARDISGKLLVPSSPRTVAEERTKGEISYQYCGRGGLSWAIPYCAGVLALGWQLRPDLSATRMHELLIASAHVDGQGAKYINPAEFIRLVEAEAKRAG